MLCLDFCLLWINRHRNIVIVSTSTSNKLSDCLGNSHLEDYVIKTSFSLHSVFDWSYGKYWKSQHISSIWKFLVSFHRFSYFLCMHSFCFIWRLFASLWPFWSFLWYSWYSNFIGKTQVYFFNSTQTAHSISTNLKVHLMWYSW